MSKPETIKIDEVEYVRKDGEKGCNRTHISEMDASGYEHHGINLVVLDSGFVYVGRVTTDEDWCYVSDASNIRVWGTKNGLSELVNGPTSSTKLDKAGAVKANRSKVIHLIECKEDKWNLKL